MGYQGNLEEKVPELTGCFFLSLFPQIPICIFYACLQWYCGEGFTQPFELVVNVIYICMLCLQVWFCYHTIQEIIKMQSIQFFLNMKEDVKDNDP
jgi:hypothetical protein